MSAQPLARRGVLATALAAAEAWLLEPVEEVAERAVPPAACRPVVAVFGLGRGCGVTTVARALGAELAARDPAAACVVSSERRSAARPLASSAATRLARSLEALPGSPAQAAGRLCLVECGDLRRVTDAGRRLAPVVLDAGSTAVGGAPAALADHVLLVASPRVEPALAAVTSTSLARVGPEPLVVLNRATAQGWNGRPDLVLPEARTGARLAHAGREPRGTLGRAVAEIADLCEAARA